jgi:DNA repair protein RadC
MKDWPETERPVERLKRYGAETLSEAQLLSIIIGASTASSKKTSMDLSTSLLKLYDNLQGLESASITELCSVNGINEPKAIQIKGALELGKRVVAEKHSVYGKVFSTSEDVSRYYIPLMQNLKKEVFKIVLLNSQNCMMKDVTVSEGSLNASIVHPREVFRPAIKESAASILLVHNHPSGTTEPSSNDKDITAKLVSTGEIIGISVLDHIIVGKGSHFSFCDENLI